MVSQGGTVDDVPLSLATDRAEAAPAAGGPAVLASAVPEQQRRRISVSSEISEQGVCCQDRWPMVEGLSVGHKLAYGTARDASACL